MKIWYVVYICESILLNFYPNSDVEEPTGSYLVDTPLTPEQSLSQLE